MASEGPKSPASVVNVAGADLDWLSPEEAVSSNNIYANVTFTPFTLGEVSDYLRATDFGFAIPTGATIDGIVAEFEAQSDVVHNWNSVLIVKGGVSTGTDQSDFSALPTTDAYKTFGSSTNLWGTTWTAADINGTGFGVQARVTDENDGNGNTARIDHIRITVYYTETFKSRLPLLGAG